MWLICVVVVVFLTAAFDFVLVFVFLNVGFGFHVAVYFFVVCPNRDTLAFNLCLILFFNLLRILCISPRPSNSAKMILLMLTQ